MISFSRSLDAFARDKIILCSPLLKGVTDWCFCTQAQADMFYYGNVSIPEGKRRKPGTLELEDVTSHNMEQIRQSEMLTELNWCDLQLKLHQSSDNRAIATLGDIYTYARACRDHVRDYDKNGYLDIIGEKPVRPQ
ncbi:hypothetical protein BCT76_02780 [Vibrio tasmaniensis]|uniref:hypothetical protein n=1 Tax=Vibrio tasmaniensis TaxID=212663 RepID=UPI000C857FF4|nr:hypothetical protein [Vibrio tasmaniensis]PML45207.1 hypothetical protein BCT76_02780 [Vibrio tasmaniensis]